MISLPLALLLWALATDAVGESSAPQNKDTVSLYNRAVDALRKNNPEAAIKVLRKCITKNPKACACLRALGIAHSHPKIEHARAAIGYLQAYVDQCPDAEDAEQFYAILASQPPRTPGDLGRCTPESLIAPSRPMPSRVGEAIRYRVDINGLSMGVVDVKIERQGKFEDRPVIEYRATFNIDSLVSTFLPLAGRAAALIPVAEYIPVYAMNHYQARGIEIHEETHFSGKGPGVTAERRKIDKDKNTEHKVRKHRRYPTPIMDFLTGFYSVRALDRDVEGCAIFFSAGVAHTIWVKPDGQERVKTPAGLKMADRYALEFASEISKAPHRAQIWLGQGEERLPYRALVFGENEIDVKIHMYEPGR